MKVTDRQKKYIRLGLWTAGLCWCIFFLTYAFIVFGRAVLPWLEKTYIGFPLWTSAVFYILTVLSAVFIFCWFFTHLMKKK